MVAMKKIFVLAGLLFCMALSVSLAYAELADWEEDAYYDFIDSTYTAPEGTKAGDIKNDIVFDYNISVTQLNDIIDRALDREPTDREWEIFDALGTRADALPKNSPKENFKEIYQDVAAQFGISLIELYEIDYRCWEWELGWMGMLSGAS